MSPTTQPVEETEQTKAAKAARVAYLQQQAFGFMQTARATKVQLMLADINDELGVELREHLYNEFIQCAGIVEVKGDKQ